MQPLLRSNLSSALHCGYYAKVSRHAHLAGTLLQWRKCLGEGHDFYVVLMAGCASIVLWVELGLVLLF